PSLHSPPDRRPAPAAPHPSRARGPRQDHEIRSALPPHAAPDPTRARSPPGPPQRRTLPIGPRGFQRPPAPMTPRRRGVGSLRPHLTPVTYHLSPVTSKLLAPDRISP